MQGFSPLTRRIVAVGILILLLLGAVNLFVLVAISSIVGAVRGTGVFVGSESILPMQLFLMVLFVSLLSLAVVVAERAALLARERTFNMTLLHAQEQERSRIGR